jgi:hypothetical protein
MLIKDYEKEKERNNDKMLLLIYTHRNNHKKKEKKKRKRTVDHCRYYTDGFIYLFYVYMRDSCGDAVNEKETETEH